MTEPARIHRLSASMADRIAAGEVVERPASIVKELVDNAVDAGATRIVVELEAGGVELVRVVDDGVGIVGDDLELAVTRHATSKLREVEDLVEIHTMGFRGEALASIAAVAHLTLRSCVRGGDGGVELRVGPGRAPERGPGLAVPGTSIEIRSLFAAVPARRKFLRGEATEVAHCTEAVLRTALVHCSVRFELHHDGREILVLPAVDEHERIRQVLERRGGGALRHVEGEHRGVRVRGWFSDPRSAARNRSGTMIVVRKRVVRDRVLSQIVAESYGDRLGPDLSPVACLFVEPPRGTVDVNVHPQKSEVRFAAPQDVFAAVRAVLSAAASTEAPADAPAPVSPPAVFVPSRAYALPTRALDRDYGQYKAEVRSRAEWIEGERVSAREPASVERPAAPELLAAFAGPIALFRDGESLLVVDLRRLRSHLVLRRLSRDLGAGISAQGLLSPVVVRLDPVDAPVVFAGVSALAELGIVVEPFGADAVRVRAIPAQLEDCVESPDVARLIERLLPWLRLRNHDHDRARALSTIADTPGPDPAPRLARRWLQELVDQGDDVDAVPGVVRLWPARVVEDGGRS